MKTIRLKNKNKTNTLLVNSKVNTLIKQLSAVLYKVKVNEYMKLSEDEEIMTTL